MIIISTAVHPLLRESIDPSAARALAWEFRPETPDCPAMFIVDRKRCGGVDGPTVIAVQRGLSIELTPALTQAFPGSICVEHLVAVGSYSLINMTHNVSNDPYAPLRELDGHICRSALVRPEGANPLNRQYFSAIFGTLVIPENFPRYRLQGSNFPALHWRPSAPRGVDVLSFSSFYRLSDPNEVASPITLEPVAAHPAAGLIRFDSVGAFLL